MHALSSSTGGAVMTYDLPKPSPIWILLHCFLLILCGIALFIVLGDVQKKKSYDEALRQLKNRNSQLSQAYQQVDRYMDFIDTNPYYQDNMGEPQWEKIDETWVELSYDKLLERLAGLYRQDRPFVLDYFGASLGGDDTADPANSSGSNRPQSTSEEEEKSRMLTFHLQGYFLCPCR